MAVEAASDPIGPSDAAPRHEDLSPALYTLAISSIRIRIREGKGSESEHSD